MPPAKQFSSAGDHVIPKCSKVRRHNSPPGLKQVQIQPVGGLAVGGFMVMLLRRQFP